MAEFLTLAFGLLVPPLVSWLKDCQMPDALKILLSLLASILAGMVTAGVSGELDWRNVAGTSAVVFTVATTVFKTFFQDSVLDKNLSEKKVL